jgi:hypothetical protein
LSSRGEGGHLTAFFFNFSCPTCAHQKQSIWYGEEIEKNGAAKAAPENKLGTFLGLQRPPTGKDKRGPDHKFQVPP